MNGRMLRSVGYGLALLALISLVFAVRAAMETDAIMQQTMRPGGATPASAAALITQTMTLLGGVGATLTGSLAGLWCFRTARRADEIDETYRHRGSR